MKGLVTAVAVVVLALSLVSGIVFGLGDDALFVSPPDVVAQEFVRALALGRTESARSMLARGAESRMSNEAAHEVSASLRSRLGRVDEVDGTVAERARDTTAVQVHVDGERGDADFRLSMVREYGAWSVARANGLLDVATPAPASHR
jgi:hypothetical protein